MTARSAVKEQYQQALTNLNIDERDIAKLDNIKLVIGIVGVFINLLLMASQTYEAWFKGTAIFGGQPFDVYASLGYVTVGMTGQDTKYFQPNPCPSGNDACPISSLCAFSPPSSSFPNGAPKYTEQEVWCQLDGAGRTATLFLWVGLLPGLAATALTLIYASKDIDVVGAKITELVGFVAEETQKRAIGACWAASWAFQLVAMFATASLVPNTLGIGPVYMESSFGLLRLWCAPPHPARRVTERREIPRRRLPGSRPPRPRPRSFLLTTLAGSILITQLFKLWDAHNVAEAWAEFSETKFLSAKKALYFLIMFQASRPSPAPPGPASSAAASATRAAARTTLTAPPRPDAHAPDAHAPAHAP